ncbi:dipeptidase [Ancylobacter amanitiformis]|uniref:Acetylornithine deacetylase/succinyl-diaminopimelate desuccinylase-like protein n=1 Tax=Ancylobacter amanitiformis TaxID=217069 RepID=A0ABU0LVN1_9HYPH|nr:dipeptidase [Ancylobacter amanitiformis]MDQ0512766.1 acetylornithine deacetylase/succinyl-diaminopimelate desuccinylase-like protein [Ancylobacter amanitiformis]
MSDLDRVLAAVDADLDAAIARLFDFLRIPSISTDRAYAADCRRAGQWLVDDLAGLGLTATLNDTPGHPVVTARSDGGAGKRVLFYGHYDVQPVDPLNLWDNPPFEPTLIEGPNGERRIVARGSSDDKGQVMTFVEACRAYLKVTGALPVDVTFLVEGEEESGSGNLPPFLAANREPLKADIALVCDTSMWDRHTPAITISLRGLMHDEIVITCANRDLHSGYYGGAAANPLHVLSKIIASVHGADGHITIPGFYDGVSEPPDAVKAQWASLGLTPESFLGPIGLTTPIGEAGRSLIEMTTSRPTFEVNGMWGGYIGEGGKTVIPSIATAKITCRLVAGQDPRHVRDAVRAFIRAQLPPDATVDFLSGDGSPAVAVSHDNPNLARAAAALEDEWGRPAVTIGGGGSIPIVGHFKKTLDQDTLLIGFALDDDRIHSPNEKYDLASFHKGIRSWVRVLAALAD